MNKKYEDIWELLSEQIICYNKCDATTTVGGWLLRQNEIAVLNNLPNEQKFDTKGVVLMDMINIVALCIACFMAGVQYGKDHANKK